MHGIFNCLSSIVSVSVRCASVLSYKSMPENLATKPSSAKLAVHCVGACVHVCVCVRAFGKEKIIIAKWSFSLQLQLLPIPIAIVQLHRFQFECDAMRIIKSTH